MVENNPIRVFVSHTFSETDDYLRVFEFLEGVDRFFYLNVSKPENIPENGGLEAIKEELISQIKESEGVIILASLYDDEPDSVNFMIDVARAHKYPVIVIRPFGGLTESNEALLERADEEIKWDNREIADALRRLARLEDTARWDVIDFP